MKKLLTMIFVCSGIISGYSQTSTSKSSTTGFSFEGHNFNGYSPNTDVKKLKLELANISNKMNAKRGANGIVTLPVVVHVIYNGTVGNISDAQIQNGITYLNEAFSGTGFFNNGLETNIRFKLAQRDPNGLNTTGITRDQSQYTSMDMQNGIDGKPLDDQNVKNINRWDPTSYVNIWIVNDVHEGTDPSVAGYAYLPNVLSVEPNRDGIIMESEYFGSSEAKSSVIIHEIGHYLGLLHTFEGGCTNNDCSIDGDGICDTPPVYFDNTYSCTINKNSCTTDADDKSLNNPFRPVALGGTGDVPDYKQNFMDYSNFECYQSFTQDQGVRMYGIVNGIRTKLLSSLALYPCSTPIQLSLTWPTSTSEVGQSISVDNATTGATSYQWMVNGALVSSTQNLAYTPTQSGSYNIQLIAKNNDQYCDVKTNQIFTVTCPVQSSFTYTATQTTPNQAINFTNSSSKASSYEWYVNDVLKSTTTDFSFSSTSPGLFNISLKASNSFCTETANDVLVTVNSSILPQTGLPVWPIIPVTTSLSTAVDFRNNPISLSTFPKSFPTANASTASPAFDDCGNLLFYAIQDGTTNSYALNFYDTKGIKLNSNGGLNGIRMNGKLDVVRVPGKSNDWFIIYKEWTDVIKPSVNNETYTPTNWRYAQVHYTGANDFTIISDNALKLSDGSTSTYSTVSAVSRTVNGDPNKHYLYLMQRIWGSPSIEMHRYIIDNKGISFEKSTGQIANYGWSNIGCSMVSGVLSNDENLFAATARSYGSGDNDIILIDCKYFDNETSHYKKIAIETCKVLDNTNTWVNASSIARINTIGQSVCYLAFSPNNKFLFFTSGGNGSNISYSNYLGQLELNDNIFALTDPLRLRVKIRDFNVSDLSPASGLYDISQAFDGNLYFVKRAENKLFVIPQAIANNYMVQDLVSTDIDFSDANTPNIVIPDGNGFSELPNQINGYNYLNTNAVGVDIALNAVDCNGNCNGKTFNVELFNTTTNEVVNTFSISNCNSTIHFCADYFTKYSLRETLTGKVYNNVVVNSKVVYPADQVSLTFLPEATCGNVCNMSDASIKSITQVCQGNTIELSVEIQNNGLVPLSANLPITVYKNIANQSSILSSKTIGTQVDPSKSIVLLISVPRQDNATILVHLNDDGINFPTTKYSECDYLNNKDSVHVSYPQLTLDLGPDFTMCQNDSKILTANPGFTRYIWLKDYSSKQNLTITGGGIYTVEAIDGCGVLQSDAVTVTIDNSTISIANDTSICENSSDEVIVPIVDLSKTSIYPSTGVTQTTSGYSIKPSVTTSYIINAPTSSGCKAYDNFTVTVQQCNPICIDAIVNTLTQVCQGNQIVLSFGITNNGNIAIPATMPFAVYANTISNATLIKTSTVGTQIDPTQNANIQIAIAKLQNATIIVQLNDDGTFGSTGGFPVTTIKECDFTNNSKSISVNYPLLTLDLGDDFTMCPNETRVLTANPGFVSYLWTNNNTTNPSFIVNNAGTFTVNATDVCGNVLTDNVVVKVDNSTINFADDITLCANGTDKLIVTITNPSVTSISPTTGVTTTSTGYSIKPSITTTYSISSKTLNACPVTDIFTVTIDACKPVCKVSAGDNVTTCSGQPVTLTAKPSDCMVGTITGCSAKVNSPYNCSSNPVTGSDGITINAGQTVYISSYSGTITMNGGTLIICGNTSNLPINSGNNLVTGTVIINGTVTFSNLNINNGYITFKNYGTSTFQNATSNAAIENYGTMTFNGDFTSKNSFINMGTITENQSLMNSPACTFNNQGLLTIKGTLHNNSNATILNSCTINANQYMNDYITTNSGTITANDTKLNGSSIYNASAGSILQTATFSNDGIIKGDASKCATIKITQSANVNSSNITGIINVCGITSTNNSTFNSKVLFNCGCAAGTSGIQYAWTPASGLNDATSATPTILNPKATTTYTVKVTDANGSTNSDDVTVTVIPCSHVTISPNPYTQFINIVATTTVTGNATIYVRNSQGQLITQQTIQTNNSQAVWLNWLTNGSYTVQVVTSEYTETKTIIKN